MDNKKLAKIFLDSENYETKCEAFIDTLNQEASSDEDDYVSKGFHAFRAIMEDNIDDFLISLCGWSFKSLLKKACIIHDDDKTFYPEPIEAKFVSVLHYPEQKIITKCKINMQTFEVFDIEPAEEPLDFFELDAEYVEINDKWFPVFRKDEIDENNITDFWYEEDE